jgi:hypothetical protein
MHDVYMLHAWHVHVACSRGILPLAMLYQWESTKNLNEMKNWQKDTGMAPQNIH